jgi:hypothetical protein
MINKNIILVVGLLLSLNFIYAVPQIITTTMNLTIFSNQTGNDTLGTYKIYGEGGQLTNTFGVNGICNFSYTLNNIPLIFSRDIQQNETDLATCIRGIATNNNISKMWQECILNLSLCQNDVGYKGNFTQCDIEKDSYKTANIQCTDSKQNIEEDLKQTKSRMWVAIVAALILAALAWRNYTKITPKFAKNPFEGLPSGRQI